jgi:3-oxoacyl-(acyl-carrier-protein) synthase
MYNTDENTMNIYVTGAAAVRNDRAASFRMGIADVDTGELFRMPQMKTIFKKKSSRTGRFDRYTRTGCAAAGLALHDAGLLEDRLRGIGFILAGQYGSFVTDLDFFQTTMDGGQFASPNLFSYTLPNIVIGECALRFGLMGPTYCLDSDGRGGGGVLHQAVLHLEDPAVEAMLVGWLDILPEQAPRSDEGAIVIVLEKQPGSRIAQLQLQTGHSHGLRLASGETVEDIAGLARALELIGDTIKN